MRQEHKATRVCWCVGDGDARYQATRDRADQSVLCRRADCSGGDLRQIGSAKPLSSPCAGWLGRHAPRFRAERAPLRSPRACCPPCLHGNAPRPIRMLARRSAYGDRLVQSDPGTSEHSMSASQTVGCSLGFRLLDGPRSGSQLRSGNHVGRATNKQGHNDHTYRLRAATRAGPLRPRTRADPLLSGPVPDLAAGWQKRINSSDFLGEAHDRVPSDPSVDFGFSGGTSP